MTEAVTTVNGCTAETGKWANESVNISLVQVLQGVQLMQFSTIHTFLRPFHDLFSRLLRVSSDYSELFQHAALWNGWWRPLNDYCNEYCFHLVTNYCSHTEKETTLACRCHKSIPWFAIPRVKLTCRYSSQVVTTHKLAKLVPALSNQANIKLTHTTTFGHRRR